MTEEEFSKLSIEEAKEELKRIIYKLNEEQLQELCSELKKLGIRFS